MTILEGIALGVGLGCVIIAGMIILVGLFTRKPPVPKPTPPKKDEDYWPNYQPSERKLNQ